MPEIAEHLVGGCALRLVEAEFQFRLYFGMEKLAPFFLEKIAVQAFA